MHTIDQQQIAGVAYRLLSSTANNYPRNFLEKLFAALESEKHLGSKSVLLSIIENILSAVEENASLCQDTGVPVFHVFLNPAVDLRGDLESVLIETTAKATMEVPIRRNVVEPFSYENIGNNTGWGAPFVYYHYCSEPGPLRIRTELKGFGGEIKSTADWVFTSAESMKDAVLAYVINNVILSRGEGCIPGFLGVGVGGYVSEAMFNAKNSVFRELNAKVPLPEMDSEREFTTSFEKRFFRCINRLGLGPMGGGGKTTALAVYLERRGTHTSVAPVAVSQQCWASRGSEAVITEDHVEYLTPHVEQADVPALRARLSRAAADIGVQRNVYELTTPIDPEQLLKLRVGDVVYMTGTLCTARDGAHRRMADNVKDDRRDEIPEAIRTHGAIYHCGPVIFQRGEGWDVVSAGPTTSSRFTTDAAFLTEQGICKAVIGKGAMGIHMTNALKGRGVFMTAVGGCAVSYRKMIQNVAVEWLDLGFPEAVWVFEVKRFGPLVVGIDSTGESASQSVMSQVYDNARLIYEEEGMDPNKHYVQYPQTFAGLSLEEVIAKSQST